MYELIKSDYEKKTIPAHFKIYNITNEKVEGLKEAKLLQLPKLFLAKFNNGTITKEELEEQYYRGLESRGQHLISLDYGNFTVMLCDCKTYNHSDGCPMQYLKKYWLNNLEFQHI